MNTETSEKPKTDTPVAEEEAPPPMSAYRRAAIEERRQFESARQKARSRSKISRTSRKRNRR